MEIIIGASFEGKQEKVKLYVDHIFNKNTEIGIYVGNLYDYIIMDYHDLLEDSGEAYDSDLSYLNKDSNNIEYTQNQLLGIGIKFARSMSIDEISEENCLILGSKYIKKSQEFLLQLSKSNIPILTIIDTTIFSFISAPKNIINIYDYIYLFQEVAFYGIKIENDFDIEKIKRKISSIKKEVKFVLIVIYEVRNYQFDEDGERHSYYYPFENRSLALLEYCTFINIKCKILRILERGKYEFISRDRKYGGKAENGVLLKYKYNT